MKRLKITALFLSATLLFGCGSQAAQGSVITGGTIQTPKQMQITAGWSFAKSDGSADEDAVAQWEAYMADLYGFEFDLTSYDPSANNGRGMAYLLNNILYNGQNSGLVELYPYHIQKLIQTDKILPLDDLLANNKVWLSLPEDFRKTFELNGHIWAIPKTLSNRLRITAIRTDWLEAVGKEMPTSTAELMEVGQAFATGDPDEDGNAANNYLLGYYSLWYADLLASFGLYVNARNVLPIGYDPTLDAFTDAMFKPQAEEALQYLKTMLQKGIADPLALTSPNEAGSNSKNGLYGTSYGSLMSPGFSSGNLAQYESLPPLSGENPVTYTADWSGYVLLKETKEPKETINTFVDMAFGSKQSFLDCCLGEPSHFSEQGNQVYVMKKDGENVFLRPNIVNSASLVLGSDAVILTDGTYSEEKVDSIRKAQEYEKNYIDRYTKTGQLVRIPVMNDVVSDSMETYFGMLQSAYNNLMLSLLNEDITVGEALETYRTAVKGAQIEIILQEANANIGKKSPPLG